MTELLYFAALMLGLFSLACEINDVKELVQSHLNCYVANEDWENEKRRALPMSSPRGRLSFRRKTIKS